MRSINVWAYHVDFGTLCRNGALDKSTGLSYPQGNEQGQAGWHVTVPFESLNGLARRLSAGVAMPKQFCGNWIKDCDAIQRREIARLAILAHGDQGGVWAANGKQSTLVTTKNVAKYQADLNTIGLYTSESATILLCGCLSGQGAEGTNLLIALSRTWPKRTVVGFRTLGYRHPGAMKRLGEPCELPGMRETDATAELYANPPKYDAQWSDFKKMPWAAATTRFAKVVEDGHVIRCPEGELCTTLDVAKPPVTTKHGTHRRR
jgi:hypothetical protein